MSDRPFVICRACSTPVPTDDAVRGLDGEPYHRDHRPRWELDTPQESTSNGADGSGAPIDGSEPPDNPVADGGDTEGGDDADDHSEFSEGSDGESDRWAGPTPRRGYRGP